MFDHQNPEFRYNFFCNLIPLKLLFKNKFIVLVGFMGAGKTSLGRGLSKKLNLPHIDTDYEIEKIKNMKISNIFEFYGENYFRELEQDTIINIISKNKSSSISLGGGSFLNIKLREYIKNKCISIWINVNIDIIYKRINRIDCISSYYTNNLSHLYTPFPLAKVLCRSLSFSISIKTLFICFCKNSILTLLCIPSSIALFKRSTDLYKSSTNI